MSTITFFFIFVPIIAVLFLAINFIFAPHNPYQEKDSAFECGFHSFLGQNRTQFSISFFIFALLFLLFDLEILLVYPYVVSAYANGVYGLMIMLIFFLALTLGFAFELGKNALKIDSRQMITLITKQTNITTYLSSIDVIIRKKGLIDKCLELTYKKVAYYVLGKSCVLSLIVTVQYLFLWAVSETEIILTNNMVISFIIVAIAVTVFLSLLSTLYFSVFDIKKPILKIWKSKTPEERIVNLITSLAAKGLFLFLVFLISRDVMLTFSFILCDSYL